MIQEQMVDRGIRDPRVLNAFRSVPRDYFFPAGTRTEAFADRAAPIGMGQMISQPYMVALMTQRLSVLPQSKVLEVGTGSGYQTAVLAHLAAEVFTIERLKPLLDAAFERLLGLNLRNIHFRLGDGTLGWPTSAPFDRILITAGAPKVPEQLLLSHLSDKGIAVLPVGPTDEQMLVEVHRAGDRLNVTDVCPCRFVPLVGIEGWTAETP